MFVDRQEELAALERAYGSGRAELLVIYGRRRVGKTELLREFCRGKPHVFFVATLGSDAEQLAAFSTALWRQAQGAVPEGFTFPSWEAAFTFSAQLPERPLVVMDEFSYLVQANGAIPSLLQKAWDEALRSSRVMLVLSGSYVGLMEREVLAYRAPLYGRRTGGFVLQPLELPAAALFFPAYSAVQKLEAWSVLGGMPYYLESFTDSADLWSNIRETILGPRGLLYREPQLVLMEELREPRNYFSILRAIAQGNRRLSDIVRASGLGQATAVSRYLDVLQGLRLVVREVPATESQPHKSKKGLYKLEDHFLRFWFRYVQPHQGALELGLVEQVLQRSVQPTFDQFVSFAFEEAARQYVARVVRSGQLPFLIERVGSYWDGNEEIDVVAADDVQGALLVGECKWWAAPVGLNVLAELKRKAALLPRRASHVKLMLFAKSGFTPELEAVAAREGVSLVGVEELLDE